jgi:hypothetical protein
VRFLDARTAVALLFKECGLEMRTRMDDVQPYLYVSEGVGNRALDALCGDALDFRPGLRKVVFARPNFSREGWPESWKKILPNAWDFK